MGAELQLVGRKDKSSIAKLADSAVYRAHNSRFRPLKYSESWTSRSRVKQDALLSKETTNLLPEFELLDLNDLGTVYKLIEPFRCRNMPGLSDIKRSFLSEP